MSEQSHFDYTAENPTFIQHTPKIKILGVKNLIPIEVTCELDGIQQKITTYVDYSSNELSVPDMPQATVDKLSKEFFDFIYKKTALPSDMFAEERPIVPEKFKEEDVQW